jgi:DNA-directed RNA polymerase subunit RPC12/RpoP
MGGETKSALCGKCKVLLEGPVEAQADSVFSCPRCGEKDTLENIMLVLKEYTEEFTARFLQEKMRSVARGSKLINYRGNRIPERSHRFIVDIDL